MILAVPEAVWSLIAAIALVMALALVFRRTIEQVLIPRVSGIKVLGLEVSFAKDELDAASKKPDLAKAGVTPSKGDQNAALERARARGPCFRAPVCCGSTMTFPATVPRRRMLQAFGVMVDTVATNSAGMAMLAEHHDQYDMVISDIARRDGSSVLSLAREVALSSHPKPLIFYVTKLDPGTPEFAFGITNRPDHLLHYVVDVVARWRRGAARR